MIQQKKYDQEWLADIESRDNIFSEIDYRVYLSNQPV